MSRTTARLLGLALALAFLHHVDHALRVDHSGWPFRDNVTPFTYSLGAYPVILFAWLGPSRLYWIRWTLLAAAAAFTVFAHTAIETPYTQYVMWAHNRSLHADHLTNALNVESTVLGVLSVTVGLALNITAVASTVVMLVDGLRGRRSVSLRGSANARSSGASHTSRIRESNP